MVSIIIKKGSKSFMSNGWPTEWWHTICVGGERMQIPFDADGILAKHLWDGETQKGVEWANAEPGSCYSGDISKDELRAVVDLTDQISRRSGFPPIPPFFSGLLLPEEA